ncbi:MAG: ferritin-like domain-containing protein [Pseudonocardiales bacterium]
MTKKPEMQISEHQLRAMTEEMNEMHNATFPQLRAALADFGASVRHKAPSSRRSFLMGSGVAVGGLALAACSSKKGTTSSSSTPAPSSSSSSGGGKDNAALATNASLENLAVFAYGSVLKTAPSGKFGKVPAAVAGFAQHAMAQHADHAKAFNAALMNAGGKEFTDPDPALKQTVLTAFGGLKDVPGVAKLALLLENTAAATYTKQMGTLMSPDALSAVATIAPVERQHAAILHFVLGEYPVPDTFVPLDMARPDTDAGVK